MFRKIKLLFLYIKILKENKENLKIEHGISIDWVYRMYKTYTISPDELDNIKSFGFKYLDTLIKKDISDVDKYFMKLGLSELCGLMEVKELNSNQIGIAFRFKYLDTFKIFKRLFWLIGYGISGTLGFLLGSFSGCMIGLLIILGIYIITRIIV